METELTRLATIELALTEKKELAQKAMEAYPKLVDMFKKNKKANHKITLNKAINLVYGVTTKGDIIVDFGQGKHMRFWDFIRSLD